MRNLIKSNNKKDGFTIIEVVLVLAIAGLIFLVVFLALPQLQASRRDNQRRRDAERVIGAVTTFQQNNNDAIPAAASDLDSSFISTYLNTFEDPETGAYTFDSAAPVLGVMQYVPDEACSNSVATTTGGAGAKNFAVVVQLEQGTYCVDTS